MLIADYGNDLTTMFNNHFRKYGPLFVYGGGITGDLGIRPTFADVSSIAVDWLEVDY